MMRFLTWAVGNRSVKVGVSLILPDKARSCGSDQPMIDSIVVRIYGTAQIITIAHENVKRFRYDIVPVFALQCYKPLLRKQSSQPNSIIALPIPASNIIINRQTEL